MDNSRKRQKRLPLTDFKEIERGQSEADKTSQNGPSVKSRAAVSKSQDRLAIRAVAQARVASGQAKQRRSTTGKIKPSRGSEQATRSISAFFRTSNVNSQSIASRSFSPSADEGSSEIPTPGDDEIVDEEIDSKSTSIQRLPKSDLKRPEEVAGTEGKQKQTNTRGFKLPRNVRVTDRPPTKPLAASVMHQSWSELYAPSIVEELAINKKKVAELQAWLEGVVSGSKPHRFLVIKGPTGAGKSTTLKVLANYLDLHITEWNDPLGFSYSSDVYRPLSAQFEDFIHRATSYGSFHPFDTYQDRKHGACIDSRSSKAGLVLIEDLSSICRPDSTSPPWFASTLLEFLAKGSVLSPVVLVVSDSAVNTTENYSQSINIRKLLGHEVMEHELVTVIDFNAVASSFMIRALHRIIHKQSESFKGNRKPTADYLKQLSRSGDIRSAINALQMGNISSYNGEEIRPAHRVGVVGHPARPLMSESSSEISLQGIDHRETQLSLFHAIGKVVYNKRYESDVCNASLLATPKHLTHRVKARNTEASVDALIADIDTDLSIFVSGLHENFVPSCAGSTFTSSLEDCSNFLSDSDLLDACVHKRLRHDQSELSDVGSSRMREVSTHVAVRGILFSLPDPVTRSVTDDGDKAQSQPFDVFKMFYPASLRLRQRMEETLELVRQWLRGRPPINPVESTSTCGDPRHPCSDDSPDSLQLWEDNQQSHHSLPQRTLILEQIPYLHQISSLKGYKISQSLGQINTFAGNVMLHPKTVGLVPDTAYAAHEYATTTTHSPHLTCEVTTSYLLDDDIEDV